MQITKKYIEFEKVLSYKGIANEKEVVNLVSNMKNFIEESGANITGKIISSTEDSKTINGNKKINILIPIDREVTCVRKYDYLEKVVLGKCLVAIHKGNPNRIENTLMELKYYLDEHKLIGIQPIYSCISSEDQNMVSIDDFMIEFYLTYT